MQVAAYLTRRLPDLGFQINVDATRDIDLYQILLGLTPPWQVTAVAIAVRVEYPAGQLLHCPKCEAVVPRTHCPNHGVLQLSVPWAEDQSRFTAMFEALTALSWDQVDRIMDHAVARGLDRRRLESLRYLGIDEKNFGKGHDYVSVLCDLDGKRVLDVIPERKKAAALGLLSPSPRLSGRISRRSRWICGSPL